MKILKFKTLNLPLFKNNFELDFTTTSRVYADSEDLTTSLSKNININNVISLVGINASGKTAALRLISVIYGILAGNQINNLNDRYILGKFTKAQIEIYYYRNNETVNKLSINLSTSKNLNMQTIYLIDDEKLYSKKTSKVKTKNDIFMFDNKDIYAERTSNNYIIQDDCSIILKQNIECKDSAPCLSTLKALYNPSKAFLGISYSMPDYLKHVIKFLDPTIEKFYINNNTNNQTYKLKFYNSEMIDISSYDDLKYYLSSGTIKGIPLFLALIDILRFGACLLVDEIENHFNKEIVLTFIRLFNNSSINKKGSTLVFSTHYPEILDEFKRNDCICIMNNTHKINSTKLSTTLKRNDIKKSEAYISGFLPNTNPSYDAYIDILRELKKIEATNE